MSFLTGLFGTHAKGESVVLVDINARSIAGAYARFVEGEQPAILYTRRVPIEIRGDEAHGVAMLRALKILGNDLIKNGAPILLRETGSGTADTVLVSVDAPWQDTSVRTEVFEDKEPFVFTKSLVEKRLEETAVQSPENLLVDESIIGTLLNGYATRNPYGHEAHRATIMVLTSLIDEEVAQDILTTLSSLFHTKNIYPIAGSSLRYQAIRVLFPHEHNALIVDVTGESLTTLSLVRNNIFVLLTKVATSLGGKDWATQIVSNLAEIATRYPLPRTIFLIARESDIEDVRKTLDEAKIGSLWLVDNPPRIVSVLKDHLLGSVRQMHTAAPDVILLCMAIYHESKEKLTTPDLFS